MSLPPYEELEHTADWALLVRGATLGSLFENAAQGMLSLLNPQFKARQPVNRSLELDAIDLESLLISWLEELLFQIETESIGFQNINVQVDRDSLKAQYSVVPLDSIERHIKAVTYNEIEVQTDANGFITTIVFDV